MRIGYFLSSEELTPAEMIEQATCALVQHVGGYVVDVGVPYEVEQGARLDGGSIVVVAQVRRC